MRTLRVNKFSSISEATLPVSPITLLVGPQASGKSVLCKLCYFFGSLLDEQILAIIERRSHKEFSDNVKAKFIQWFPQETWGKHKFEVSFSFGDCRVDITRTLSQGRAGKSVRVHFCENLVEHFERSLEKIKSKAKKIGDTSDAQEFTYSSWILQRSIRENLQTTLGNDFVSAQLFIPAGRSFFTSIGKAIAAFENSNMLDPLTLLFGRMYAARESYDFASNTSNDKAIRVALRSAIVDMLGGQIVKERERDREVLHTKDGRTIPLGSLSSGQQELFPLLRVLPQSAPKGMRRLVYVEEPEAHLFPDAQSRLVELLSTLMNLYGQTVEMVITTHSPYVLTKFNNLIAAGQIGRTRFKASAVSEIVSSGCWVGEGQINAYGLIGGELVHLIDSDGLIDGNYLDEVSNHIGAEYTRLLDVHFALGRRVNRGRTDTRSKELAN